MAENVCWKCGRLTHLPLLGEPYSVDEVVWRGVDHRLIAGMFHCQSCKWPVIGLAFRRRVKGENTDVSWLRGDMGLSEEKPEFRWLPQTALGKEYQYVPQEIAAAASEAHQCHSIGAYRGSQAVARAVVEATAKDKGIMTGSLSEKIQKLEQKGFVREGVRKMADQIRLFGNSVAHGDFADPTSIEESQLVLSLMDEVLEEVYESPGRLEEAERLWEAKKVERAT